MRKSLTAAFLFLCALSASAGTITSLSPNVFNVNSGEQFITVYGTDLGNVLVFDGPAGHYEVIVNAQFSDRVIGWVPERVIAVAGAYTLSVNGPLGSSGPVSFSVKSFRLPLALLMPEHIRIQPRTREGIGVKYDVYAIGGADSNPTVTCDPPSGSFFPMGTTTVKCAASNIYGERAFGDFNIYVRDEIGPSVSVPLEPIVVRAETKEGAIVNFKPTAYDDIYGEAPVTCLPASGSIFPVGVTNVQCSAADFDGNVGHGTFAVEVIGERKPYPIEVIVPENIVTDAWDPRGAAVQFEVYVKGTDDRAPQITCTHKSGEVFPVGDTVVACDALDAWGMRANASFTVSVMDRVAPTILELYARPDTLLADNRLYPIEIYASASDDIDFSPKCEIQDVTSKEDIHLDDEANNAKTYDWHVTGPLTVELRAERFGTSRVYNVWVLCSDYFGNWSRARASVTVSGG
ncbi:MAG TPA: HYR domain-containing protein, partial [Thermoanaerobaculia bacterium]|nr:HYR domain-containing protein [Thermoanaerobaculia bacterium]